MKPQLIAIFGLCIFFAGSLLVVAAVEIGAATIGRFRQWWRRKL